MTSLQEVRARGREQRVRTLWERGVRDTRELGRLVGVTDRTVCRYLLRIQAREAKSTQDDVDYARLACLAEEGMPANWIAEDLGISYGTALRHANEVPGRREHVREWTRAWHAIRQDPALLALHWEITPPRSISSQLRLDAA